MTEASSENKPPVLIAGLPKTGTTGLGAVVHAATGGGMATEPTIMAQVAAIPDCRVAKLVYPEHETRTLAEFMAEFATCERRVWIHRDPRDQLVSVFFYTWFRAHRMPEDRFRTALGFVQGRERGECVPFSTMLERTFGPNTYYHDSDYHLGRVLPYFHSDDASSLFRFAYEDLIAKRFGALSAFLDLPLASSEVEGAQSRVIRSRGSGEWRRWFQPEDADRLRPLLGPYMELMGYEDDWEVEEDLPEAKSGSLYMLWLRAGGIGPRPQTIEEAETMLVAADQRS